MKVNRFPAPLPDEPAPEGGGGGGSPPAPPAAPAAPAAASPWYGADLEADDVAYIERNGFKGVKDTIKSARNLETFVGADKATLLRLPADRSDPAAMADVYRALGRPDDVAGYGVTENPDKGLDGPLLNIFLDVAHKHGASTPMVNAILEAVGNHIAETVGAQTQKTAEQHAQALAEGEAAIRTEFGAAYDAELQAINGLLQEYGSGELDEYLLESGRGNDVRFAKFLSKIAKQMAEPPKLPGEPGRDTAPGAPLTPAAAEARLADFEAANEAALRNAYHPDHKRLVDERMKLIKAASGGR